MKTKAIQKRNRIKRNTLDQQKISARGEISFKIKCIVMKLYLMLICDTKADFSPFRMSCLSLFFLSSDLIILPDKQDIQSSK